MRVFPNGHWRINSILIDRETVINNEGFRSLEITDDEIVIQPAGTSFSISQATPETAVLESCGQRFYGNFVCDGDTLMIDLTRQKFKEAIQIEAELVTSKVLAASN